MQFTDIQKKLRQHPFKPFRMHLTDGTAYEVRHPELLLLGRRMVVVGMAEDPEQTVFDRSVDIDLFHIIRLEYIESHVPPNGDS